MFYPSAGLAQSLGNARVTPAFRPGFGPVLANPGWPTGTTYTRFFIPWLAQWLGNGQGQPCFQSRLWSSFGQARLACWSQLLPICFLSFFFICEVFYPMASPAMAWVTLAPRLGFDRGFPRSSLMNFLTNSRAWKNLNSSLSFGQVALSFGFPGATSCLS